MGRPSIRTCQRMIKNLQSRYDELMDESARLSIEASKVSRKITQIERLHWSVEKCRLYDAWHEADERGVSIYRHLSASLKGKMGLFTRYLDPDYLPKGYKRYGKEYLKCRKNANYFRAKFEEHTENPVAVLDVVKNNG